MKKERRFHAAQDVQYHMIYHLVVSHIIITFYANHFFLNKVRCLQFFFQPCYMGVEKNNPNLIYN